MSNEVGINLQQDLIDNFDIINKGIRPEGMNYDTFKYYRRLLNGLLKRRLSGQMIHISSNLGMSKGSGVTYNKPNK